MNALGGACTGKLTEDRVRKMLEDLGLTATKPWPDNGVDLEATNPKNPGRVARIQVKGRNPKTLSSYRWFQLRVSKKQLERVRDRGLPAEAAWMEKVQKVDFFVFDAVRVEEMWLLSQGQVVEIIRLNEKTYGDRPDNLFVYETPLKGKQKEMNLDLPGVEEAFGNCRNNFAPLLEFLGGGG